MLLLPKTQPNSILYVPTIYDEARYFDKLFSLWSEIQQLPENRLDVTIDVFKPHTRDFQS
ncbi:hypothetical protein H6G32_21305 [Cylindrospermum sp. FACHB-282]|nr:hypothetical protein [Cylindrospermum sp. FACHB-282]